MPHYRNETVKLGSLRPRGVLDATPERSFDNLTVLAAQACDAPFAFITFIEAGRHWLKSKLGMAISETTPGSPFCAHAIQQRDLFVVRDALADKRFATDPSVTSDPPIRFYAGVPLLSPEGHALGALCVIDHVPRDLSVAQQEALRAVARQVMVLLELRRNSAVLARSDEDLGGGVAQDTKGEEKLNQSDEWLAAIFETSRDGILVEDDEIILCVNEAYAHLFGYDKPEELIGRHVSIVLSAEEEERMLEFGMKRLRGESSPTVYEFRGRRKDGTLIELEASISTPTVSGKTYITTAVRDVSERKRSERALRESEGKYRTLVEQASDGIHTYDFQGNFIEVNSKLCEMLGYTRAELLRINVKDLLPAEDLALAPLRFDELRLGDTVINERRVRRKDGSLLPVEISGKMVQAGVLQAILRDITERKMAEEALRRAHDQLDMRVRERTAELASVNEALLGEIAERRAAEGARTQLLRRLATAQEDERRRIACELHDQMGQHLTALILELKSLKDSFQSQAAEYSRLQRLQELATKIGRELHTVAWQLHPTALDDFGLCTALLNYVEEWSARCGVSVDFHNAGFDDRRLPPDIETALYRIVLEALNNVSKHAQARRVSVILERRRDYVLAIIEDDGCGFDNRITAGAPAAERKLGLIGMRERATLVNGTINVESSPGMGTTLFIHIPTSPPSKEVETSG
ncbi:hypothetical protein BH20ACI3_BH20ACI3_29060 [soil metagenome]